MSENIKNKVKKRKHIRNKKITALIVAILTLLSATFYHFYVTQNTKALDTDLLTVKIIDVGQGDASLILTPDGSAMLIDTGMAESKNKLKRELDKAGFTDIDFAVFTHPDEDHIGNAEMVLSTYDIITVLLPDFEKTTGTYKKMMQAIDESECNLEYSSPGTTYQLGRDAEFIILAPLSDYGNVSNNYSIVLRLEYGENTFLFMGDAEGEVEADLTRIYDKNMLSSDVIKLGHHGSATSSTEDFIRMVMPFYAVVSCGKNNTYGHPSGTVVNRLQGVGANILRTDKNGTIIIQSDGKNIYIVE